MCPWWGFWWNNQSRFAIILAAKERQAAGPGAGSLIEKMNYRLLGWISVALAVLATSPYWLRTLNSWTLKSKDKRFMKLLKFLRKWHKLAGLILIAVAAVHGLWAVGWRIKLHTGSLVYLSFLLTVALGAVHFFKKDKRAFKGHKVMALVSFLFFLLHLIKPWALGQWFGLW